MYEVLSKMGSFIAIKRRSCHCLIGIVTLFCCLTNSASAKIDWGFLYANYTNIIGEHVVSALGPVYQTVQTSEKKVSYKGIRPFYANVKDADKKREQTSWLWPVANVTKRCFETSWRFLVAYGRVNDIRGDSPDFYRFRIFPFYFQSRADGRTTYALFPIGGVMRGVYFFDEAKFVLFPIWSQWRVKDYKTTNVLWPFFSWSNDADGNHQKRNYLPFYAHSKVKDVNEKWAVMWPFWTYSKSLAERAKGYSYVLWPLFGRVNRVDQKGWMFLPPIFRVNYGERGALVNFPWPFIHYKREHDMKSFRVWPLFGGRKLGRMYDGYVMWPFIWYRNWVQRSAAREVFQVVPFLIFEKTREILKYDAVKNNIELGEVTARAAKVWPFYHYRRVGKVRQTRMFDFWPFYNGREVIARTWAPYWTLLTHTVVEDKGYETEALWGLYRRQRVRDEQSYTSVFPLFDWECDRRGGGKKEWSFLKGLFGYKREDGIRRYRLLYFFEFGGRKEAQP